MMRCIMRERERRQERQERETRETREIVLSCLKIKIITVCRVSYFYILKLKAYTVDRTVYGSAHYCARVRTVMIQYNHMRPRHICRVKSRRVKSRTVLPDGL